jgi:hypothetical protein
MLGRARPGQPDIKFETGRQFTRRFENMQQVKKEVWGRWIKEVFPELLKQGKWTRDKRNVRVGDIVLRKDETAAGQTYKYARVIKVHVGTDGRVRSADIDYRLPGETRYRTTTRPIHKMVLRRDRNHRAKEARTRGSERGRSNRNKSRRASTSRGCPKR